MQVKYLPAGHPDSLILIVCRKLCVVDLQLVCFPLKGAHVLELLTCDKGFENTFYYMVSSRNYPIIYIYMYVKPRFSFLLAIPEWYPLFQ